MILTCAVRLLACGVPAATPVTETRAIVKQCLILAQRTVPMTYLVSGRRDRRCRSPGPQPFWLPRPPTQRTGEAPYLRVTTGSEGAELKAFIADELDLRSASSCLWRARHYTRDRDEEHRKTVPPSGTTDGNHVNFKLPSGASWALLGRLWVLLDPLSRDPLISWIPVGVDALSGQRICEN